MVTPAALREQIQVALKDRCQTAFLTEKKHLSESFPSAAGEIPRGALTEIAGPGRTSLLYSLLAGMTARQEFCALLDAENSFDPGSAEAAGVKLSQILWVRCGGNVEHAFKAADMLSQGGGFGMVAIDLGNTSEKIMRRVPLAAWFRLRHGVEDTRTAMIVVANRIHARSCSALKIELEKQRTLWRGQLPGGLLNGFEIVVRSTRNHRVEESGFLIRR